MAITEYEDQIKAIIDKHNHEAFIYDFLSVYEKIPKATITKLRKGLNNLSKEPGEVYLKNKLYFKETNSNLMQTYVDIQNRVNDLGTKPRFIIVTDYNQFLAKDMKTYDSLDIEFSKLPQKFEFFLAWNGIEKADFDKENPADVRAAERFAKLYDVVARDNPDASRKGLNLFLIRVLFCLFAEDTNIFADNLFTNRVKQMTKEDGTDFDTFVSQLFGVLDFKKSQRPVGTPSWLNNFPYVDGDLFKDQHESLHFSAKARKLIIESGELLKWDQINPDILGSMIQAVASEDSRSHLGMHYTSVPNIMKVIKPLFLDGLREDFEVAKGNENRLQQLYDRIGKIKFMDPACGSGNFLIITYKELRQLEIDILIELNNIGVSTMYVPSVTLDQFYGIEIDDFACDVTRLSLWIAEHQMNVKLHEQVSDAVRPTLPLHHAGAIMHGNALRLDWSDVMPHSENDEVYLFGNPPYLGSKLQNEDQKRDLKLVFNGTDGYKKVDYISAWFILASLYIGESVSRAAFVTTNSVNQGEQVALIWKRILRTCQIFFCYTSFLWHNNAKNNAGVTVSIIGIASKNITIPVKSIFNSNSVIRVQHISPYLSEGEDIIVKSENSPINGLPKMFFGSMPRDDGNLILTKDEKAKLTDEGVTNNVVRKYVGSKEFISNNFRYCLWMDKKEFEKNQHIPFIRERVGMVKDFRQNSKASSTRDAANTPWSFVQRGEYDKAEKRISAANFSIIVPRVSSQNRLYVPMGILDRSVIVSDSAMVIYGAPLWLLGLLESSMHMVWLREVGGKLKTDYRYSAGLVYNTFPVPQLSSRRKNEIEEIAMRIIDTREEEGGTLAELYGSPLAQKNPKPMNANLLDLHKKLDLVVDRAYGSAEFRDDSQRLAMLLGMYKERRVSLAR